MDVIVIGSGFMVAAVSFTVGLLIGNDIGFKRGIEKTRLFYKKYGNWRGFNG